MQLVTFIRAIPYSIMVLQSWSSSVSVLILVISLAISNLPTGCIITSWHTYLYVSWLRFTYLVFALPITPPELFLIKITIPYRYLFVNTKSGFKNRATWPYFKFYSGLSHFGLRIMFRTSTSNQSSKKKLNSFSFPSKIFVVSAVTVMFDHGLLCFFNWDSFHARLNNQYKAWS